MRARSRLSNFLLVAKIVAFAFAGECIALPIWGLTHATRAHEAALHCLQSSACARQTPAATMDPLSRQLFGSRHVTFKYAVGRKVQCQAFEIFLFGKLLTKLDYTEIVAAPSGSKIWVTTDILRQKLIIRVRHPLYEGTQQRSLFKYAGNVLMENEGWMVRDDAPSGVATRVIGRQVYMAYRIGVRQIGVYGAGSYGDPALNGYYTWPRLGFNVLLDDYKEALEADGFHDVPHTNDLFSRVGGPEWWKLHGKGCYGLFDLAPDSTSSLMLRRYLKTKGAVPYEGAD